MTPIEYPDDGRRGVVEYPDSARFPTADFEKVQKDLVEVWKPVPKFPGYQVSSFGNVRGKSGQPMTPTATQDGYLYVSLRYGRKNHPKVYVHHLVATAFIGPRAEGIEVHHRDNNRQNNRPDNLMYLSPEENKALRFESLPTLEVSYSFWDKGVARF